MLRITQVYDFEEYKTKYIEEKTVSIIEAIEAYAKGKKIVIYMGDRFCILDKGTTFQTDFEYLVNSRFMILP